MANSNDAFLSSVGKLYDAKTYETCHILSHLMTLLVLVFFFQYTKYPLLYLFVEVSLPNLEKCGRLKIK